MKVISFNINGLRARLHQPQRAPLQLHSSKSSPSDNSEQCSSFVCGVLWESQFGLSLLATTRLSIEVFGVWLKHSHLDVVYARTLDEVEALPCPLAVHVPTAFLYAHMISAPHDLAH